MDRHGDGVDVDDDKLILGEPVRVFENGQRKGKMGISFAHQRKNRLM